MRQQPGRQVRRRRPGGRRGALLQRQGQHAGQGARQRKVDVHLPAHGRRRNRARRGAPHEPQADRQDRVRIRAPTSATSYQAERDGGGAKGGQVAQVLGGGQGGAVQARGRADVRGQLPLLVPGPDGVRPAGARQQEHTGAQRLGRGEGEAQPLRQAEGVVPAVRAVDAGGGRAEAGRIRQQGLQQVHDQRL